MPEERMNIDDDRIKAAVARTEIIRLPRQSLATFGLTNIYYYLITEPSYPELMGEPAAGAETVIREGRIIAEKPRIVTPYYLSHLEGFSSEARRYLDMLIRAHGAHAPGLFYSYKNEPASLSVVSDGMALILGKLNAEIDKRGDRLTAIIKGEDGLWDVSLLRFIYELTRTSIQDNLAEMNSRGLLDVERGIPVEARLHIEEMIQQVLRGEREPHELKEELDRWCLFEEYQDRFFSIFHKKR